MLSGQKRFKIGQIVFGALFLSLLVVSTGCRNAGPDLIIQPIDPDLVQRGKVLATGLAACGFCHGSATDPSAAMAGGQELEDKFGKVLSANITPSRSGIGTWTTNEILRAIRAGLDRNEDRLSQEMHTGYAWMSDADTLAIISFLRSQVPIDREVDRRSLSFVSRNTTGLLDRSREVLGYVPSIGSRFQVEYGQYLTDHVARCAGCHNSPEGIMANEQYLAGGKIIANDEGERAAPGITGSEVNGLGSWSEKEIVNYLKTSTTPDGRISDPHFCPTAYFRQAPQADLEAIARYLKTVPAIDY